MKVFYYINLRKRIKRKAKLKIVIYYIAKTIDSVCFHHSLFINVIYILRVNYFWEYFFFEERLFL